MNKSVMKCCICNNENIGEFITINDKKYHLCCIEQLQQENQKLKIQISAKEEVANKYKEVIDKAINDLDIIIDIVREQPFGDRWIINRLEANKNILKEVE